MVRVRFAPSPTGIPHVGNTRTALFNFLFARHNKGEFILRIEDTDRTRFIKESEDVILQILKWLGLSWDNEIVRQSKRLSIYKEHAEILRKKGMVYEDKGALRFKMPKLGETSWKDAVGGKDISFKNETQEDFVILKSDDIKSVKDLEQKHLDAIQKADFLYVCDPGGYIGRSVSMEIGYAHALGRPIYALEKPEDAMLAEFVETKRPSDLQ